MESIDDPGGWIGGVNRVRLAEPVSQDTGQRQGTVEAFAGELPQTFGRLLRMPNRNNRLLRGEQPGAEKEEQKGRGRPNVA